MLSAFIPTARSFSVYTSLTSTSLVSLPSSGDTLINSQVLYRLSYGGMPMRSEASDLILCWRLPIFPGRRQPSIFGTTELNFCVRNGTRWTLCVNGTNLSTFRERLSIENRIRSVSAYSNSFFQEPCSSSIRSISIGQLNALLRLHLRPIKLVVCK